MGTKLTAVVAAALMLLGVASGAAAQELSPGTTVQECAEALAAGYADGAVITDAQQAEIDAFVDGWDGSDPEAALLEVLGILFGDISELPDGLTPDSCTIYGVGVLPGGEEQDDGDVDDGEEEVDDVEVGDRTVTPTEVRGVTRTRALPVTGTDVAWIAGIGLAVLALGSVALRRTSDHKSS